MTDDNTENTREMLKGMAQRDSIEAQVDERGMVVETPHRVSTEYGSELYYGHEDCERCGDDALGVFVYGGRDTDDDVELATAEALCMAHTIKVLNTEGIEYKMDNLRVFP